MRRFGGAVTHMRQILDEQILARLQYQVGTAQLLGRMPGVTPLQPFDDVILDFLDCLSKELLHDREAKKYPDVITFAFWIRRANVLRIRDRFCGGTEAGYIRLGRGMAFHIAPSNVPVNYAYSFATGLLTGNANVIRIPARNFPQINVINSAVRRVLTKYGNRLAERVCFVRYGHEREITDELSAYADVRIIWGGNETIQEIRRSPLQPRATEIAFADRYSMAVINAYDYLLTEDKDAVALGFYNDTYLTDQNACTSPRIVVWTGGRREEAREVFWGKLHDLVADKYSLQPGQAVDKLVTLYLQSGSGNIPCRMVSMPDNLICRVRVDKLSKQIMDFKGNSGFFVEYDCDSPEELEALLDSTESQTISYVGDIGEIIKGITLGVKGIDRIVPVGRTMDFDLIWDGYNLFERLIRMIDYRKI